jgi:hypothetical protein
MREQHIKPDSTPVYLHNYLPERFTFYWDKEAYTLDAGEKVKMFKWLAVHGAVKLAEKWFSLNLTNAKSTDPKVRGFYSRHDDDFKAKVKEAIIEEKTAPVQQSEVANAIAVMNEEDKEEAPAPRRGRPPKAAIELPEAEDEIIVGCAECHATGPRHKPTCSKFTKHEKDEAQAAKLREATA